MVCFDGLVTFAVGTAIEFLFETCWLIDPGKLAVEPFPLPVSMDDD